MREIKFRGKCIATGEWLYGDLSQYDSGLYITYIPIKYGLRSIKKVKSETVGQYTGLKDKNGREIYEGDIVECFRESASIVCMKMNAWGLDTNGIGFKAFYEIYGHCEIIGNVYENRELLEESK